MNYIKALQAENSELKRQISEQNKEIDAFISFLHSEKFQGQESDGGRKDWISTGDVLSFLRVLRSLEN